MGIMWASKNCRNGGEGDTRKTAIKELARGLVKQESRCIRDKVGKQDTKERQKTVRENQKSFAAAENLP